MVGKNLVKCDHFTIKERLIYNEEEWTVVDRPMIFKPDGSLVICKNLAAFVATHGRIENVLQRSAAAAPGAAGILKAYLNTQWDCHTVSALVEWPIVGSVDPLVFRTFPKLPTELRHKILKSALPDPRMVVLSEWIDTGSVAKSFYNLNGDGGMVSDHFILSELDPLNSTFESQYRNFERISKETRKFLYENYLGLRVKNSSTTVFQANSDSANAESFALPQIHGCMDMKQDTLILLDTEVDQILDTGGNLDLSLVKNLALSVGGRGGMFDSARSVLSFLDGRKDPLNLTMFFNRSTSHLLTTGPRCPQPTPYFLEIDDRFEDIIPENMGGYRSYTPSQREHQLRTIMATAESFRKEFQSLTENYNDLSHTINLKVCLLGWIFPMKSELRTKEHVYLIPKHPKYHDVLFYAKPPAREPHPTKFRMMLKELSLGFECLKDGTPIGKYDEYTGVCGLFEEQ